MRSAILAAVLVAASAAPLPRPSPPPILPHKTIVTSMLTCTAFAGKPTDTVKALSCVFYVIHDGAGRAQYYGGTLTEFGRPLPAWGGRLVWHVNPLDNPDGALAGPYRLDSAHPPVRNLIGGAGNAITLYPVGPSGEMAWAALATISLKFLSASP